MAADFKPHAYQTEVLQFMLHRWLADGKPGAGVLIDPGMGKTPTTLSAFQMMRRFNKVRRALIVAPLRVVYSVWPKEIRKWSEFENLRISIVHGTPKQRVQALRKNADIHLINADGIRWLVGYLMVQALKHADRKALLSLLKRMKLHEEATIIQQTGKLDCLLKVPPHRYKTIIRNMNLTISKWGMLIVDESSQFKTPGSQRTQALTSIVGQFRYRTILTGTPAPNSLVDLFSQAYILDTGETFGGNISEFHRKYCRTAGFQGYSWEIRNREAEEEIQERLAPLVIRMDSDDHLDLPDRIYNDIWLELEPAMRKKYNTIESQMFVEFEAADESTRGILINSSGGKYAACKGLANGGLYEYPEWDQEKQKKNRATHHLHEQKTAALMELIGELQGKPLIVAYQFDHDVERIERRLKAEKLKFATIKGGVSAKKSDAIIDQWNAGKLDVLVVQPQALSHGANLQFCGNDLVWYGLTDRPEVYQQFNKRLHRQGVVGTVRIHHILAERTVEEAVLERLQDKDATQKALFKALERYRERMKHERSTEV